MELNAKLIEAAKQLAVEADAYTFSDPVAYVYNPLSYAFEPYARYLELYAATPKKVLFLGMNPGPWGMAQTGIPFGEISFVRDWLGITGQVHTPPSEHPKRRVTGFSCPRSEVSGRRLWSFFSNRFASADLFFRDHFVANYCPLMFVEASGRNRTPDKLPVGERDPLFEICDRHLIRLIELLEPEWLIGIGTFTEKRLAAVAADLDAKVGRILHPSPANPAANRNWEEAAYSQLKEIGVW